MTVHWKRWAIIVSIAWAIVGGNAGVQLAVAPAVSAYRHCVTSQAADAGVCHAALQRDWADQSGDRLDFAAADRPGADTGWLAHFLVGIRAPARKPRRR